MVEFPGIMPNPTYDKVMEGARLAKSSGVQMILGIGGGSVMDCCKAVSLAAQCENDPWRNYWEQRGIIDFDLMDPVYTFSASKEQMASGAFDSLTHIMETYFSAPDEQNVSDAICEALMRSVILNIRLALEDPLDYTARSNLFWGSTLSENRLIKLGKQCDFACHLISHQLGAYTDCGHGQAMAVLQPAYCRHIYRNGTEKLARFAGNVWGIRQEGKTKEELAESCTDSPGSSRRLMPAEILEILMECY